MNNKNFRELHKVLGYLFYQNSKTKIDIVKKQRTGVNFRFGKKTFDNGKSVTKKNSFFELSYIVRHKSVFLC